MGDSDKLQVGDWVLAVGSPFGLAQTVTQGIISAKERVTESSNALQQFLQTDAAINPGNSGGPLVNLNGEVIGINTQIATRTGTYNGIGFALPSSTAVEVYNQLVNGGQVHRGYLGILPGKVPAQMAKQNNLPEGEGALVNDVSVDDGPAAKAGVKSGDIIVEFNGYKIKDDHDLVRRVAGAPVGTNAVLKFVRDGQVHTVNVKLAERPGAQQASRTSPRDQGDDDIDRTPSPTPGGAGIGIEVETFTARKADQLGMKPLPGVLITNVIEGSVAEDVGLRRNYIILQVNKTSVTTADDYNRVMKTFKSGEEVVLQVARRTATGDRQADETLKRLFISVTIP
jgi:serine protease Do